MWNIDDVKNIFIENGCILLEKEYKNNRTKLKFKCKCSKIHSKTLDAFLQSPKCRSCGYKSASKSKTYTQKEVSDYFSINGCELLGVYEGVCDPIKYKCSCGKESKISFSNFKRGKRCKSCGHKKYTGENHPRWIKDREKVRIDKLFRSKCYKALSSSLKQLDIVKKYKSSTLLGYTPQQLQKHIVLHPNWEKVKDYGWHLDHIYPIKAFIDHGISDLSIINSLDNLQPLLEKDNLSKSDNYDETEFERWLEKWNY